MNRKLIRPNLTDYKEKASRESAKKKSHPASETFAENYYYLKQMNKKIPLVVVFKDGETIEGYLEWYDKECLKLNRDNEPNLLIFKHSIKYLYKREAPVGSTGKSQNQDRKKPVSQRKT